jgi:hypothetical protein
MSGGFGATIRLARTLAPQHQRSGFSQSRNYSSKTGAPAAVLTHGKPSFQPENWFSPKANFQLIVSSLPQFRVHGVAGIEIVSGDVFGHGLINQIKITAPPDFQTQRG